MVVQTVALLDITDFCSLTPVQIFVTKLNFSLVEHFNFLIYPFHRNKNVEFQPSSVIAGSGCLWLICIFCIKISALSLISTVEYIANIYSFYQVQNFCIVTQCSCIS